MSKFTQNEETEIVKSARDITATIEYEEREVKRLKSESFSEPPEPPVRKILEKAKKVEPKYPEKPQTALKYSEYFKESIEEKVFFTSKNFTWYCFNSFNINWNYFCNTSYNSCC